MSTSPRHYSRVTYTPASDDALSDVAGDDSNPTPLPRKRQKKSTTDVDKRRSRPRKRQGLLAGLVEMPIDVLFEIFGHLEPLDLLNLTRTSKALRNLLMQRPSTTVWKSARRNLSHPDLYLDPPEDMSEPEYARLLFDTHCHFCLSARVKHPYWAWRVRCCKTCLSKHFYDTNQVFDLVESRFLPCQPREDHPIKRRASIFLKTAVAELQERVQGAKAQGQEALSTLLTERTLLATNINKRAADERRFARLRENLHETDLQETRQQRQDAIKRELCALGWEEELNLMSEYDYSFKRHPLVAQLRPLTDRIWSNIKDPVIKLMEEVRATRLEKERVDGIIKNQMILLPLLGAYRQTRAPGELVPQDGDIVCMPPFATVLESGGDVPVTAESFAGAFSQLQELSVKWREEKDEFLLSLIPTSRDGIRFALGPPKAALHLATTLFHCKSCMKPISYPRILVHSCMTQASWAWMGKPLKGGEPIEQFKSISRFPWNYGGDWLAYDRKAAEFTVGMLLASGSNPRITTAQEMDLRNLRFVCPCKRKGFSSDYRYFMNWRCAIEHARDIHSEDGQPWAAIGGSASAGDAYILHAMRTKEQQMIHEVGAGYDDFCCRRCITFRAPLAGLKTHLQQAHGITMDKMTEVYYFRHPDAPPSPRAMCLIAANALKMREVLNSTGLQLEFPAASTGGLSL